MIFIFSPKWVECQSCGKIARPIVHSQDRFGALLLLAIMVLYPAQVQDKIRLVWTDWMSDVLILLGLAGSSLFIAKMAYRCKGCDSCFLKDIS